jgi:hypothetical protein
MPHDPSQYNPYSSPQFGEPAPPSLAARAKGKVMPPAIALIVVGSLGLLMSLINLVAATVMEAQVDPNAPQFLQDMQQWQTGPLAAVVQGAFAVVNIVILAGAAQMIRMRNWGLAMTSTILAMVNIGTCCCVIGLPIGIWSLVVLLNDEVKSAFS